jgi:hypothetical protein
MREAEEITVLVADRETRIWAEEFVSRASVVSRPTAKRFSECRNLFVLTRASQLGSALDSIRDVRDRMRVLFMYADVSPEWISETLYKSKFRSLRNLIVHAHKDPVVGRVLRAWKANAQDRLIADAAVVGETLEVRSCAMDRFAVPFSAIPALAKIPVGDRASFEIEDDGVRISWPTYDVDLDLDSIVCAVDSAARARLEEDSLLHDHRLGSAIAHVRRQHALTQSQIPGVSERQLRRVEKGLSRPRLSTLELLASAHNETLPDYLDAVARATRTA